MEVLALVLARGGSKGLPRKNLVDLGGRPLLAWTVSAATAARCVTRVLVSTDDQQIAAVARECGAEAPFLRPPELATDESRAIDALLHALRWLAATQGYHPDVVVNLQPTSPFRNATDIDGALGLLNERAADSVVSVTPVLDHPYWTKRIDNEGWLKPFMSIEVPARRQELPPAYRLNGAIYMARRAVLEELRHFYPPRTSAFVMPHERSIDIDTASDLQIARCVVQNWDAQASV